MESMHSSAAYRPVNLHELKWSPGEKGVARKVFDEALQRELDAITQEVKRRARGIKVASELWELEEYLTESRKKINGKYDYRYSTLPNVFGQLLREGRISIDELRGLGDDKVAYIRLVAGFEEKEARRE
jgi:Photoprotection regulator fluorescence recovery protein